MHYFYLNSASLSRTKIYTKSNKTSCFSGQNFQEDDIELASPPAKRKKLEDKATFTPADHQIEEPNMPCSENSSIGLDFQCLNISSLKEALEELKTPTIQDSDNIHKVAKHEIVVKPIEAESFDEIWSYIQHESDSKANILDENQFFISDIYDKNIEHDREHKRNETLVETIKCINFDTILETNTIKLEEQLFNTNISQAQSFNKDDIDDIIIDKDERGLDEQCSVTNLVKR